MQVNWGRRHPLTVVCCLALLVGYVTCTAYTFSGTGGNNQWLTATNWSPNGVPGTGDTATIPAGFNVLITANTVLNAYITNEGTLTISTGMRILRRVMQFQRCTLEQIFVLLMWFVHQESLPWALLPWMDLENTRLQQELS
jgi:hypothetical protein